MKVTITLGSKAMEYVTGIPEDELPEILSDVVERSLAQQVRDVSAIKSDNSDIDFTLMLELKSLISELKTSAESSRVMSSAEASSLQQKKEMVVKRVKASTDTSAFKELTGDLMDLLK